MATVTDVHNVVKDFVSKQISFTSVDVTRQLRQNGLTVRHRDVSGALRNSFDVNDHIFDGYMHTMIDVTTRKGPARAWLYHNVNTDPSTYAQTQQVPKQQVPIVVPLQSPTKIFTGPAPQLQQNIPVALCQKADKQVFKVQHPSFKLSVPKYIALIYGFKPGDCYEAIKVGNVIRINKANLTRRHVTAKGRMWIAKPFLFSDVSKYILGQYSTAGCIELKQV